MPPPSSQPTPLTLAQSFLSSLSSTDSPLQTYDSPLLPHLHITSATLHPTPSVTTTLTVSPTLCNALGTLHGGATATVFDLCTTLPIALLRRSGEEEGGKGGGEPFWQAAGVSRTLSVAYLKAVGVGETVEVVGEIVGFGSRLAHVRGVMRRIGDGEVVATAEHGKVNIDRVGGSRRGGGGGKERSKL